MVNTVISKAIILAAGTGGRLHPYTNDRPKGLVNVGNKPLLSYQVQFLSEAGIKDIAIVVGHFADKVRTVIGSSYTYFDNSEYKLTNSLYSLWIARDFARGEGFLVLNSDVLFHPLMLKRLLEHDSRNALLIDRRGDLGEEEMKIITNDNVVKQISKNIPPHKGEGENVGIVKLDKEGGKAVFDIAEQCIKNNDWRYWVPYAVDILTDRVPFYTVPTGDLPWIEIDYPHDLERAKTIILPRILADL